MPIDYQLGKIYKISAKSYDENEDLLTYYGSTCQ